MSDYAKIEEYYRLKGYEGVQAQRKAAESLKAIEEIRGANPVLPVADAPGVDERRKPLIPLGELLNPNL